MRYIAATLLLLILAVSATATAGAIHDSLLVTDDTHRSIVIEPSRLYLTNPQGQVHVVLSEAVTGLPRGVIGVYVPATGNNILLDPEYGIIMNGRLVVPMPPTER